MCCSLWLHVLEYFFNSPVPPTYEAGIEWCAALCDFTVLEYFFNSPTHPPTYEAQGLKDVLPCDYW
jgi:hypothetical protein